eukprot:CFRG1457T1
MSLSWPEFLASAENFVSKSTELHDGWEKVVVHGLIGGTYLRKKGAVLDLTIYPCCIDHTGKSSAIATAKLDEDDELDCNEYGVIDDDANEYQLSAPSDQLCEAEYHIVYSTPFRVPVLYITGRRMDGRLLRSRDILESLPTYKQNTLNSLTTPALTQVEHPILGIPFLMVHPCRTEELMTIVLNSCVRGTQTESSPISDLMDNEKLSTNAPKQNGNYIVTWLALVAPTFGLGVSTKYTMNTMKET